METHRLKPAPPKSLCYLKACAAQMRKTPLKRFHQFRGKHARLFGQILRAHPVIRHNRFVRLAEEPVYFFRQVFLRGAELSPIRDLQILLCGRNASGRASLRRFQIPGGKLRRDLRRSRLSRRGFRRFRGRWPFGLGRSFSRRGRRRGRRHLWRGHRCHRGSRRRRSFRLRHRRGHVRRRRAYRGRRSAHNMLACAPRQPCDGHAESARSRILRIRHSSRRPRPDLVAARARNRSGEPAEGRFETWCRVRLPTRILWIHCGVVWFGRCWPARFRFLPAAS